MSIIGLIAVRVQLMQYATVIMVAHTLTAIWRLSAGEGSSVSSSFSGNVTRIATSVSWITQTIHHVWVAINTQVLHYGLTLSGCIFSMGKGRCTLQLAQPSESCWPEKVQRKTCASTALTSVWSVASLS